MHLPSRIPINRLIAILACLYLIYPSLILCSEAEEEPLARNLLVILRDTGKSARFEYTGPCNKKSPLMVPYPGFSLSDAVGTGDAISRIRNLLRDNKDMVVTEDSDGIIVIRAFGVKEDALEIPVSKVHFTPEERWNPDYALLTIWYKKRLRQPLAAIRMEPENYIFAYLLSPSRSKSLPHLPPQISGPTMRTVIDNVLRQFPGLVIYRECKREDGSRLFGTDGYLVYDYDFRDTASLDKK